MKLTLKWLPIPKNPWRWVDEATGEYADFGSRGANGFASPEDAYAFIRKWSSGAERVAGAAIAKPRGFAVTSVAEPIVRRYRAELMRAEAGSSARLLKIVQDLERRQLASLARFGENGITKKSASRVSAIANRIALESRPEVAAWFHREGPAAALNGTRMQAEYLAKAARIQGWQGLPYERVRQSFDAWQRGIDSGKLFDFAKGSTFDEYAVQWTDYWKATAESLQERFVEAAIKGESWKDIARGSVEDLDSLGLQSRMNKYAFSDAFTRTKLTEISNDAAIGMARDAGVDLFANLGVPDDRQSDECAAASDMEPMSLAEWDASDVGRPPRHVFNCRCTLLAQPSEAWITGTAQPMEAAA